jgi:hypothetical protein
VTELRVHGVGGVGGSPPDAILGDLAAEQVSGDAIAGFYRSSDHRAEAGDRDTDRDVDRHVEVFSWGGLASRSKIRVLWLALLPFLFANLDGWMCSPGTRASAWRFRLHRLTAGLCALALTVNAALIAVMISADVNAYQAPRAGLAGNQWWLAPLRWNFAANDTAPAARPRPRCAGSSCQEDSAECRGYSRAALMSRASYYAATKASWTRPNLRPADLDHQDHRSGHRPRKTIHSSRGGLRLG